jgi:hypothetical protein
LVYFVGPAPFGAQLAMNLSTVAAQDSDRVGCVLTFTKRPLSSAASSLSMCFVVAVVAAVMIAVVSIFM